MHIFKKSTEDVHTQKGVLRMYILKKMYCIQDAQPQNDVLRMYILKKLYSRCTGSKRCIDDVHPKKGVLKMDILKKMYWGCTSSKRYIKNVEFNFYQTCILLAWQTSVTASDSDLCCAV